ncbi:hypothetical protein, partial [Rufibacter quisquiliarum]|uniref:hypothetical protein n=1 Tax=Rufibacter quisquiliarum TaxID=1549639 RepID=UPI001C726FFF
GAALACPASASLYSLVYPKIQPKSKTLNSFYIILYAFSAFEKALLFSIYSQLKCLQQKSPNGN